VDVIATDAYLQGVGLGAQGGKLGDAVDEAERRTKGDYGEFLQRTRDIARDRFENMKGQ
jgi:RNA-binding protein 5/10